MPAPPMNDKIVIFAKVLDANGNIQYDSRGRAQVERIDSKARVKETGEAILTRDGQTVSASLEITLPTTTKINPGDDVEWVNPFGLIIKDTVEEVRGVLNYSGKKTYYRKAFTLHKGG